MPGDSGQRPEHGIAPNILDRQFEAAQPNQRWVADFTYVWTAEGWLYVAVILDLYSCSGLVPELGHDGPARD